ncbi:hypothetical protein M5689_011807 [Euphorbia peplus]|nr:hypothetical protein M5689_011807 [Euphorbia peplus]
MAEIQEHTIIQIDDDSLRYNQQPKIQKVQQLFRGIRSTDEFDPYARMVVSIGPFHHGKKELMEMEALKLEFARMCFPDSSEETYTGMINAEEARKFYSDGSIPTKFDSDEKFSRMMFLDGCFILHFISCFMDQNGTGMKPHLEGFVIRDLLLLENQVPFSVLEVLMNLSKRYSKNGEECTPEKIKEFVRQIRISPITNKKDPPKTVGASVTKCNEIFGKDTSLCFRQSKPKAVDAENMMGPKSPLHLVEHFHSQFTQKNPSSKPTSSGANKGKRWYCFRSAKELRAVGIHFKPSKTSNFTDVKYNSYFLYGYLSLPPIVIDDLSKSLLLNLVAYESCSTTTNNAFQISSYIVFMDSLIDQPEDVKELRSKGVLLNSLGSDQEVADMFNQISKFLVLHPNAFSKVRKGIDDRYQNKIKKWMAEWLNDHFNSPWTILAFGGAIFALVLTAIQTYVTVYPSK